MRVWGIFVWDSNVQCMWVAAAVAISGIKVANFESP